MSETGWIVAVALAGLMSGFVLAAIAAGDDMRELECWRTVQNISCYQQDAPND